MAHAARALGLGVMLGCMVESGLGIAAGCVRRAALRPRRPRRQPPARARTRARASTFVDGVQVPVRSSRASACRAMSERDAPDPRRGLLGRPALRQDDARDHPLPAATTSSRSSTRRAPGRARRASRSSATSTTRCRFEPDGRARRRRDPGRSLPAGLARAPAGVHRARASTSRAACTSSSPTIPSCVALARRARRRAARPAPAAGRASTCPTGANLEVDAKIVLTVGSDCAIGKKTVVARARPRGARARARVASSSRPARPGSRSPAGGSPSTPSSPTSSPAPRSGSSSRAPARGRAAASSRGRARSSHPAVLGRDARPHPRLGAARVRPLPPRRRRPRSRAARDTRSRRSPSSSSCTSGSRSRARRAAVACIALNTRGPRRRRRRARGDRRAPRPRPACRPTTRCASAPRRLLDALLARPLGSRAALPGRVAEPAGGERRCDPCGELWQRLVAVAALLSRAPRRRAADIGANDDTGEVRGRRRRRALRARWRRSGSGRR